MGPFIFPKPAEYVSWIPDIRCCEKMVEEIALKYGAKFLPLHDYLNEKAMEKSVDYITTDGIHLTAQGAELLAGKWLEEIANWLDKSSEIS